MATKKKVGDMLRAIACELGEERPLVKQCGDKFVVVGYCVMDMMEFARALIYTALLLPECTDQYTWFCSKEHRVMAYCLAAAIADDIGD